MSSAADKKRNAFEFFKDNGVEIAGNSELISSSKELAGLFGKVIRGYKLYPRSNPAFTRFADQFKIKLDQILQNIATISLRITTKGFMVGSAVLDTNEKDREIVFFLYNDGLREIFFQQGTTRQEVEQLFNVLATCTLFANEDYDLPTLLWDSNFDNIGYITEDELIKHNSAIGDLEDQDFSPFLIEELSEGEGMDGLGGVDEDEEDGNSGNSPSETSTGSNFTDEDFEKLTSSIFKESGDIDLEERREHLDKRLRNFTVGKMEMIKFDDALKKNSDTFVVNRFLKELSIRLIHSQGSPEGLELLETASSLWEKLLVFGSVKGAILFIKTLLAIAQQLQDSQPGYSEKIMEGLASLKDLEFIDDIFNQLEDLPEPELEAVGELFSMIPSSIVGYLLQKISNVESKEIRVKVLDSFGRYITISSELLDLTKHEDWKIVRNAIALMKDKKDPRIIPAIRNVLSHPQKQAQVEALGILLEFSIEEALPALEKAVFSSSREIREVAFNKILELKNPQIKSIVNRSMQIHNLKKLEADEIDLYFKTLINLRRDDLYDLLANNLFCDDLVIRNKAINALINAPTLSPFSKFITRAADSALLLKMKNDDLKLFCKLFKPEIYKELMPALEPLFRMSGSLFNNSVTNMKEIVFKSLVIYIEQKPVVDFFRKGQSSGNRETVKLIQKIAAKYL
ncbi:MAG TPA: HEAT repeat domain-containing protein [bacterium]|nr:HEAT repeat domain-containing protein [bacterium]HPS30098.1 HEAT repeat domain-containing protein [bacterium]